MAAGSPYNNVDSWKIGDITDDYDLDSESSFFYVRIG